MRTIRRPELGNLPSDGAAYACEMGCARRSVTAAGWLWRFGRSCRVRYHLGRHGRGKPGVGAGRRELYPSGRWFRQPVRIDPQDHGGRDAPGGDRAEHLVRAREHGGLRGHHDGADGRRKRLRRMSANLLRAACALGLSALAACNDTVEPLGLAGPPATATIVSGNTQLAAVGTVLPDSLVVLVSDAEGLPVPGVIVEWSASSGVLSQLRDTTNAAGLSAVSLPMPESAGEVTVTATPQGLAAVTFSATASPAAGLLVFRYIDAGSYHACGITTTEESVCWGFNEDGQEIGRAHV